MLCPQYAHAPVHVNKMYWISRRVLGRVQPEVFFTAEGLKREERMRQHDQRHMVMPAGPVPTLIVIQPEFLLELLVVLLDLPPAFRQPYQAA